MPIYEWECLTEGCPNYGKRVERYSPTSIEEGPPCEACGAIMARLISPFAVVWTGNITAKYNDPKLEGADQDGHWAWRRNSSRSGKPEPVFIDTWQKQAEFCREEGLLNPKELPLSKGSERT